MYETLKQTGSLVNQLTLSASIEEVLAHTNVIMEMLGLNYPTTREEVTPSVIDKMVDNIKELNDNLVSIKQKLERL